MSKFTFYTNPQSRGAVVSWMLAECGLVEGQDFDKVIIEYGSNKNPNGIKSPDYLAINPMGKLPTLVVHDDGNQNADIVITEGSAICTYLADAYPEKKLAPNVNSPLRGTYYRWLFYTHAVLEAAVMDKVLGFNIPKEQMSTVGYGNFELVINTLKDVLKDTIYLCGEQFTTADLYLCNALNFYMHFGLVEKLPEFEAYVSKHTTREAFLQSQNH